MSDWALAVAALAALAGIATLAQRVVSQLLGHIDRVRDALLADLRARFEAAEAARAEAGRHWAERFADMARRSDERHTEQTRRLEEVAARLAAHERLVTDRYVTVDRYLESDGRQTLALRRIEEALSRWPAGGEHG
jgi:hypothetical protein